MVTTDLATGFLIKDAKCTLVMGKFSCFVKADFLARIILWIVLLEVITLVERELDDTIESSKTPDLLFLCHGRC